MSEHSAAKKAHENTLPDYLSMVANALYAVTGLLFLGGLYADWQMGGQVVIQMFAIADEPEANSGLFIAAVILLAIGYTISKVGLFIEERRKVKVDETQEWTVDI